MEADTFLFNVNPVVIHKLAIACFCLLILTLLSCNEGNMPPEKYNNWISSHKEILTATDQRDLIRTTLTYLPVNWLAINEVGIKDFEGIATARNEYEGMEYYRLRISLQEGQGDLLQTGISSPEEYYQRVEYFSFGLQNDLKLLVSGDTLPCLLYHFERNYGAAPYADFMLGFDQKEGKVSDRLLIYYDKVFSNELIRLTIKAQNIGNIPKLKL